MFVPMRSSRLALPLVLVLLVAGCTTATTANPQMPQIQIEQLPASEFDVVQQGAVSVAYKMTVKNPSAEPITLRRVEMKTVGRSPYVLRDTPADVTQTIAPGEQADVTFSMWAYSRGQHATPADRVWVHGVAYFESAKGNFTSVFEQSFTPPK